MRNFLIALSLLLIAAPAQSETKDLGPVTYDRSHRFLMPSEAVGDSFRIDVILPIGYSESKDSYPVVYVTDGNYLLASAAGTQLAQATDNLPKMILVGIGWDVPTISDTQQIRARDFSPTCDPEFLKRAKHPKHLCGKADRFIEFIADELKPFIKDRYRATDDTTLIGYSFGGLFAVHALFNSESVADRYVIGSPSLWWHNEMLFDSEAEYASKHKDLPKRVYLSAGGLEDERTIPNVYRMYERLNEREYPELAVTIDILPEETHMTAINSTVMRGLRYVFDRQ